MYHSRSGRAVSLARAWRVAVAGSWLLLWTESTQAETTPALTLRWTAPPPCPGGEDVQARVDRLLGDETAPAAAQDPFVAEGTVVTTKGRYRLSLRVRRAKPPVDITRVFESGSCDSLAGAAAVTLFLLAHADRRSGGDLSSSASGSTASSASPVSGSSPESAPPVPPEAPPAPATTVRAKDEARPPDEPDSRPQERGLSVALEAPVLAGDTGTLPSWAYGLGVAAGLRIHRFRAMVKGVLWLPQSGAAGGSTTSPYEGNYSRRSGALSGCYAFPIEPFDIGPCIALTVEDVSSSGTGPAVASAPGHATWLTAGAAARAGWSPNRWVSFFVRLGPTFTTSRPTFSIQGVGPLFQVPFVSAAMDVGCEWIL